MAHIPNNFVGGKVENVVQGNGQFHRPQTGSQMAAGMGYNFDNPLPNLSGKMFELISGKLFQIIGRRYVFEYFQMGNRSFNCQLLATLAMQP
jgi:hypothetical protein